MAEILYKKYKNVVLCFEKYRKNKITSPIMTLEEFKKYVPVNQYAEITCEGENKQKILIFLFTKNSKYVGKTDTFKLLINKYKKDDINIIAITDEPLSIYIKKGVIHKKEYKHLNIKNYEHKHFSVELPLAPLVPKCRILAPAEFPDLDFNKHSFPKIPVNDPQCIWIGAKVGQIIEEINKSDMAGLFVSYRIVENKVSAPIENKSKAKSKTDKESEEMQEKDTDNIDESKDQDEEEQNDEDEQDDEEDDEEDDYDYEDDENEEGSPSQKSKKKPKGKKSKEKGKSVIDDIENEYREMEEDVDYEDEDEADEADGVDEDED